MTTKEKIYDIFITLGIWIILWCVLEYFLIDGDVKQTTVNLYIGCCLGYIMCMFTKKYKRKKK
jgi:Ca2+/Na+ antiporter